MLYYVLVTFHVVVSLFLIIVVLLQSGQAADLAGAFGGMGSQTAFGPRGSATLMSKATTVAAAIFMVTSMSLAILATRGYEAGGSTVLDHAAPTQTSQPARPSSAGGAGKSVPIPMPPPQQPAPAPAKK